jgi:hypothetical protein
LKILEDHLLWSKEFAQIVGNISIAFQLATTENDITEKPRRNNERERPATIVVKGHQ